jgi:hypothetical protein
VRNCPTHSHPEHHCASGAWHCLLRVPPCPGHSSHEHSCDP